MELQNHFCIFACSSLISVTVIKYCDKRQLGEERVYLVSISRSQFISEGNQGRNPKEGLLDSLHRITSDERTHFIVKNY